jgi:hypothetical protein
VTWALRAGCTVAFLAIVALVIVMPSRYVLGAVGVVVLLVALGALWRRWRATRTAREFLRAHPGRHLLVVYTDSPHWKSVIESAWRERWSRHIVLFDRSAPWSRAQVEARLWRAVRGREHTPLAILVRPDGTVTTVRLFRAFRDYKHGKSAALRAAEARIAETLSSLVRPDER